MPQALGQTRLVVFLDVVRGIDENTADLQTERLLEAPSDALRIAARAHHLRRWEVPRSSYPEGRAGYLRWRRDQKARHAREVADVLAGQYVSVFKGRGIEFDEVRINADLENPVGSLFLDERYLVANGSSFVAELSEVSAWERRRLYPTLPPSRSTRVRLRYP